MLICKSLKVIMFRYLYDKIKKIILLRTQFERKEKVFFTQNPNFLHKGNSS